MYPLEKRPRRTTQQNGNENPIANRELRTQAKRIVPLHRLASNVVDVRKIGGSYLPSARDERLGVRAAATIGKRALVRRKFSFSPSGRVDHNLHHDVNLPL